MKRISSIPRACIVLFLIWSQSGVNGGANTLPENVVNSITDAISDAIIGEITGYGGVTVNADSNAIEIGGAPPKWIATPTFGYDRHIVDEYEMGSSGSINGELEYAQHTGRPEDIFVQLVWVPNNDRFIENVFHKVDVTKFLFGSIESIENIPKTEGSAGGCSYTAAASTYVTTPDTNLVVVQFAVYEFTSDKPSDITHSDGEFEMTNARRTVLGHVLFSKTAVLLDTELTAIMGHIVPLVCAQLQSTEFICCQDGTAGTGGEGEPICTCDSTHHGDCCNKECNEGNVQAFSLQDIDVCVCNVEWGGPECNAPFASHHFISRQQHPRDLCQDLISNRIDYLYPSDTINSIINPFASSVNSNKVFFGLEGSLTQVQYGQTFSAPLNGISTTTEDFLFSASIDKPSTVTGTIEIKVDNEFRLEDDVRQISAAFQEGTIGACRYARYLVQRYGDSTTATLLEMYAVVGQLGYSSMWDDVDQVLGGLVSDSTSTSFKITGTEMSGLVMAYMFSGRSASGAMTSSEQNAILDCFFENLCESLPQFECESGTVEIVDDLPICRCNEGFVGPKCDLPLC